MQEKIVRYPKEEIKKMKGKTNHFYVENTSDAEIERQVQNDPDTQLPTTEELKKFKPVNRDDKHE